MLINQNHNMILIYIIDCKINVINLNFVIKLYLTIKKTNAKTKKINDLALKIYN